MENDKLKKRMDTLRIPEPDEKVREMTLKVAVQEFHRYQKAEGKNTQESSRFSRLMDKTLGGGPVMRKHLAITGAVMICIVVGVYFFVGNTTPTWAEVNQSFTSFPYHAATVYIKRHAFSETLSFEFWAGQGSRIRVRELWCARLGAQKRDRHVAARAADRVDLCLGLRVDARRH